MSPQHLQQQDAYHAWARRFDRSALQPDQCGVAVLRIDEELLNHLTFSVLELAAILPDGVPYQFTPADSDGPALKCELAAALQQSKVGVDIWLRIPKARSQGRNVAPRGAAKRPPDSSHQDLSYRGRSIARCHDEWSEGVGEPVEVEHLVLEAQLHTQPAGVQPSGSERFDWLWLSRLKANAQGAFELCPRTVTPALQLQAAPGLQTRLNQLLGEIERAIPHARQQALQAQSHNSNGFALALLRYAVLQQAMHQLSPLSQDATTPPRRIYEALVGLLGGLRGATLDQDGLPAQQVQVFSTMRADQCFAPLFDALASRLQTLPKPSFRRVDLAPSGAHQWIAQLPSLVDTAQRAFLVLSAHNTAENGCEPPQLSAQQRLAAPDVLEQLAQCALPGAALRPAASRTPVGLAPAGLASTVYELDGNCPRWAEIIARGTCVLADAGQDPTVASQLHIQLVFASDAGPQAGHRTTPEPPAPRPQADAWQGGF